MQKHIKAIMGQKYNWVNNNNQKKKFPFQMNRFKKLFGGKEGKFHVVLIYMYYSQNGRKI